jgi:hypothetical protein
LRFSSAYPFGVALHYQRLTLHHVRSRQQGHRHSVPWNNNSKAFAARTLQDAPSSGASMRLASAREPGTRAVVFFQSPFC